MKNQIINICTIILTLIFISTTNANSKYSQAFENEINKESNISREPDWILAHMVQISIIDNFCAQANVLSRYNTDRSSYFMKQVVIRAIKNGVYNRDVVNRADSLSEQFRSQFSYYEQKNWCLLIDGELSKLDHQTKY